MNTGKKALNFTERRIIRPLGRQSNPFRSNTDAPLPMRKLHPVTPPNIFPANRVILHTKSWQRSQPMILINSIKLHPITLSSYHHIENTKDRVEILNTPTFNAPGDNNFLVPTVHPRNSNH